MGDKNSDILIYVPFNKETLNKKDIVWIEAFQTILGIGLNQLTKQKFGISNFISNKPSKNYNEFVGNKIVIQLLLDNTFEPEHLIPESKLPDFKVIQVNCNPEISGAFLKDILIVNLYDEITNKTIDLSESIDELKNEIWLKILDIANDIKKELIAVEKINTNYKGKIFVAETSIDQNSNREKIIRELEHLGYEILPKVNFPKDMVPFSELVHNNIKQSFISIHLFGNQYAPLINNIDVSSIELQNDLFLEVAAELNSEDKEIKRLVWIPKDLKPKSEKQRLYIESFKRNIDLLKNTEIIQTPIEVFKTIIRKKADEILEVKPSKKISKANNDNKLNIDNKDNKSVYLITNNSESKIYAEIKSEIEKNKFNVLETSQKTNKIDLIQEHYSNLIHCDAVLIDYSIENFQWLNSKLCDLLKAPGFGRKKNFLAKSILINTGNTPVINFQINDLVLIQDDKKEINKRLNSFIEKVK